MKSIFLKIVIVSVWLFFLNSAFAESYDCKILKMGQDGTSIIEDFSFDPSTSSPHKIDLTDYKMTATCYGFNAADPIKETRLVCSIVSNDLIWPDFSYGTTTSVSDGSKVFTVTTPIQINRKNMIAVGCALHGLVVNFESLITIGH